jgi:adenine phosphoribosyltransferase
MKIISEGRHSWNIIVCGGCKAQLEISEDDVYHIPNEHGGYGYSESYHVLCACGNQIVTPNIPDEIKRAALNKHLFNMKPKKLSLRDIPDFPKKGFLFKDISPLLANPKELKQLVKYLAGYWKGKIDKVGGFDARGFIFASMLSYEMELPFFMLRKKGKLPGKCEEVSYNLEYGSASLEIQAHAVKKGERVLLIDDLLATGGTALAGCQLVEQLGGEVVGVQCIVELADLPGRKTLANYNVKSIIIS